MDGVVAVIAAMVLILNERFFFDIATHPLWSLSPSKSALIAHADCSTGPT